MPRVLLFDLDSRIPNLALMKLSTYYEKHGFEGPLERRLGYLKTDRHLASAVFYCENTKR